jgi:cytochrome c-type biogenesis protein CcmH
VTFLLYVLAIILIALLILLRPLLSKNVQRSKVERDAVNIQAAATRLSELKIELENGLITQERFYNYKLELETAALDDLKNVSPSSTKQTYEGNNVLALIVAILVPLLSILTYEKLGDEAAFDIRLQTGEPSIENKDIEEMIASIEQTIEKNPDDIEARAALAQIYMDIERYNNAATIYLELNKLKPEDPEILVSYAEALARLHQNNLIGKPTELLKKALKIRPNYGRALWLAGYAEQQANNKKGALTHWRNLLVNIGEESEISKQLKDLISELENSESTSEKIIINQNTNIKNSIQVKVSLLPELQSKVAPNTTMFIYARASKGPPMPLAVYRGLAKDLPITITLDDSMAMMPQMTLSSFPKVIIGARLSSNGQPQGQPGDYEGFSDVIEISKNPIVNILINTIKP